MLQQPVLLNGPVLLDLPEALDFLAQASDFLLHLGSRVPLVGQFLLELEEFLFVLFEPVLVGLGLVVGEQRLALAVQFLVELGDLGLVELGLPVAASLQQFVLLGPLAALAPLLLQQLVSLLELADVLAAELLDALLVLLLLLPRLPLQVLVLAAEQRVAGLQLARLRLPPAHLRPQPLHFLPVRQLQLVDHLEADDVCVVDHEEGADPAQLLVLEGDHLLYLADLLLVLLPHRLQLTLRLPQLALEPSTVGLLDPERVLDLVDDLICALQLLERVLMRQLLPADLFAQELYLAHVLLKVS